MIEYIAPELGGGIGMGAPYADDLPDFVDPTPGGSPAAIPLNLNASPEAVAFAELARQVRDHPDLRGVDAVVRSWAGAEGDDRGPTPDEYPWLRLTPLPGRRERHSTGGVWYSPISVHVDQVTAGSSVADSMNLQGVLMGLVESAAFRAAMGEAGASDVRYDEGGYGERPNLAKYEPNPDRTITAIGTITVDLYVEYSED